MVVEVPILTWLIPLTIWDAVWKGIALWRASQKKHLKWFIVLFILSTAGILPIIYIYLFDKKK